jgi:hypothetical protein
MALQQATDTAMLVDLAVRDVIDEELPGGTLRDISRDVDGRRRFRLECCGVANNVEISPEALREVRDVTSMLRSLFGNAAVAIRRRDPEVMLRSARALQRRVRELEAQLRAEIRNTERAQRAASAAVSAAREELAKAKRPRPPRSKIAPVVSLRRAPATSHKQ